MRSSAAAVRIKLSEPLNRTVDCLKSLGGVPMNIRHLKQPRSDLMQDPRI